MLAECVACCVSLLTVYYIYRKQKPNKATLELTRVVPSWSPIQILWLDALPAISNPMSEVSLSDKHDDAISNQASWSVLPDEHLSSRLSEEFHDVPCPTYPNSNLVCQERLDLSLPTSGWK